MALAGQLGGALTGHDGHTFYRETFSEEYGIPDLYPSTGDETLTRHLTQHVPRENRALQADRNLCMSAYQGDAQLVTGLAHLRKNVLHHDGSGPGLWEQQGGQEP